MKALRHLARNLLAGCCLALFLPVRRDAFRYGFAAIAPLVAAGFLVLLGLDYILTATPKSLSYYGVAQVLSVYLVLLVVGLALKERKLNPFGQGNFLVPFLAAMVFFSSSYLAAVRVAHELDGTLPFPIQIAFLLWFFLLAARALRIASGVGWARAKLLSLPLVVALVAVLWGLPFWGLWFYDPPQQANRQHRLAIPVEETYYAQPALVQQALADLTPERPGVVDLYFVGFGSYAPQDVFMKEVRAASAIVEERFDATNRSITLINNKETREELPLANRHNLQQILSGLAQVMNSEEDLLFLFLTSHGSPDHWLSVRFGRLGLSDLSSDQLAEILSASGIKNQVVLVSACFSGGFVDPLSGPNRLIMTAAAADRTSFGCDNARDWTYFGQAFFQEALSDTISFQDAFHRARDFVTAWEAEEELLSSDPQIFVGPAIVPVLEKLMERLSREAQAAEAQADR